jgi:hypothetical protein
MEQMEFPKIPSKGQQEKTAGLRAHYVKHAIIADGRSCPHKTASIVTLPQKTNFSVSRLKKSINSW